MNKNEQIYKMRNDDQQINIFDVYCNSVSKLTWIEDMCNT